MSNLIQEIKNRRILPALGVYAGSCWVLIEILDRLSDRYLLSPYITDAAFWGLYSLIPAVLLLAWAHGKPGKDRATRAEKVGVPINLIATTVLLMTMFGGKDLGATANKVTLANEEGVPETHYIPNESYRRRMVVFFFENESGNAELDWLQYGATELLVQDLQQDPFVSASSPWSNYGDGFYMRIKQAGFDDGLGVPLSLMREIAIDANRQYIVGGSVNQVDGDYAVTVRIWEVRSLKMVAELTLSGWDLYSIMDELSVAVRDALEIPHASARIAEDLPLSETYGESQEAFQNYIAGLNARLLNNDFDASNTFFDKAISDDPSFVLAWFLKAINLVDAGDLPGSQDALSKAQELNYRLPAQDRAILKMIQYRLSGQQEKLIAFLRLQVQLRNDASSLNQLAIMLMVTGELEEAKQQFLTALDKDALNLGIYLQLSLLERATGDMEAAIAYARKYQQEKPEDSEAQLALGDLLRDNGDLDAAEEHYLQASMLDNQPVQPLLRLAGIVIRKGDANEARDLLEQAGETAQTLADRALVQQRAAELEFRLGRVYAGIEHLHQQEVFLSQFQPPFAIALATYAPLVRAYNSLGDPDSAQQALDIAMSMVAPPLNQFLSFSEADILIQRGDLAGAESAVQRGAAIVDQFKLEDMNYVVEMLNGFIKRIKGDPEGSTEAFRAALDQAEKALDLQQEIKQEHQPRLTN
jgi:tetratricopeptide (TPR) repeat protein